MSNRLPCAGAKYSDDLPVDTVVDPGYTSHADAVEWMTDRCVSILDYLGVDRRSSRERIEHEIAEGKYGYAGIELSFLVGLHEATRCQG